MARTTTSLFLPASTEDFLAQGALCTLTTCRPDGSPHVAPSSANALTLARELVCQLAGPGTPRPGIGSFHAGTFTGLACGSGLRRGTYTNTSQVTT